VSNQPQTTIEDVLAQRLKVEYERGYQAGRTARDGMPFIITALANYAAEIHRVRRRVKTKNERVCWAFYEDEIRV
jgi:hypothetical protein